MSNDYNEAPKQFVVRIIQLAENLTTLIVL